MLGVHALLAALLHVGVGAAARASPRRARRIDVARATARPARARRRRCRPRRARARRHRRRTSRPCTSTAHRSPPASSRAIRRCRRRAGSPSRPSARRGRRPPSPISRRSRRCARRASARARASASSCHASNRNCRAIVSAKLPFGCSTSSRLRNSPPSRRNASWSSSRPVRRIARLDLARVGEPQARLAEQVEPDVGERQVLLEDRPFADPRAEPLREHERRVARGAAARRTARDRRGSSITDASLRRASGRTSDAGRPCCSPARTALPCRPAPRP